MNNDNLAQTIQKGFHLTLGATAALLESLQDAEKRQENLSKMQSDFNRLTEEWADKGSLTEQEARIYVDRIFNQQTAANTTTTVNTPAETSTEGDIKTQVQELTAQLAALRAELENLQTQEESQQTQG
jgi:polyhydroxyalkanoate synthesis regulator phasin